MKKSKIIISILVIVAVVFAGFSAFAADNEQITQENDATKLHEMEELRTLSSRAYAMSDGTVRHELFATDINYKDDNGNLKEIDIKVKDIDSAKNNGYKFKNGENSWDVYFADKGKAKDFVEVAQDDYSISFSMDNTKSAVSAGKTTQMQKGKSEMHDYYIKDPTAVIYSDVMNNVDLAYTIREHYLKEDIILNAAPESNEFAFTITVENLTIVLKDNKLEYNDAKTGEIVFFTENLFMEDSKGKVSTDVSMKLNNLGDGKYSLTIIVDESFLNASDTVYPVVIDPTIQNEYTKDVFVASYMPTTNMNSGSTRMPYLRTGKDTSYGIRRSYIEFRDSDIDNAVASGATIIYAAIELCEYSSAGTISLKAYETAGEWNSSEITWSDDNPGYQGSPYYGYYYGSGWYRIPLTYFVQGWESGSRTNNGVVIRDSNESSTSVWATFRSSDNWDTTRRPRLIINMYVPTPTATPTATPTQAPTATATQVPTATPVPTVTPLPTLGTLNYWYAEIDNPNNIVGRWNRNAEVYHNDMVSGQPVYSCYNNAVSQWNNAGIACSMVASGTDAEILSYGGTYDQLSVMSQFENIITVNDYGRTTMPTHLTEGNWYFDNEGTIEVKVGLRLLGTTIKSYSYILIVEEDYDDDYPSIFNSVGTHEIGHALGWYGHSNDGDDVMSNGSNLPTTLTDRDKNQLTQIYPY